MIKTIIANCSKQRLDFVDSLKRNAAYFEQNDLLPFSLLQ